MSNNIENQLNVLFVEWHSRMKGKNKDACFTKDGIMLNNAFHSAEQLEEAWITSPKKVLFLLKDQHQDGNDKWNEDIREWLVDTKHETDRSHRNKEANRSLNSRFMKNLAYILWGLSKAEKDNEWWYNEVTKHFDELKTFFNTQPFAIVECKKEPGNGYLGNNILKEHLKDYGDLLKREIEILSPNMIVCTSPIIYDFVIKSYPNKELISIEGHNSIRIHPKTNTLLFCSFHPSARKHSDKIYDGVMEHYRAFLKSNINN